MKSAKADLALIGVTAIWGCTFLLVKGALDSVSPVLFLGFRFALAAVVLGFIYRRRLQLSGMKAGCIAGLFLFGGYAFQTAGLQFTTPAKSAFLTSLAIPMVPLATSLVYHNVPKPIEWLGVGAATAGMVLLTMPAKFSDIGRGDWLTFLCAVCFAAQMVAVGHFSGRGNFETLTFAQMLTASLLSFATFRGLETPLLHWNQVVVAAVLVTGLLASALAFGVQAWALQYTSLTRAAIIFALEPVFAWITSWCFVRETLTYRATCGAALILFGILIVEMKRGSVREHQ